MLYNCLKIRAPRYVIDNCTSVQRTATVTPAFTIHWKLPMKETFFNAIYIYIYEGKGNEDIFFPKESNYNQLF